MSLVALVTALGVAAPSSAISEIRNISADYGGVTLYVDLKPVVPLDANGAVAPPFITNGTTYLPVRAVSEALGMEAVWNPATKTIYINEKDGIKGGGAAAPYKTKDPLTGTGTFAVAYDDIKIYVGGKEIVPKDAAGNAAEPFIVGGTTYLPVRAVAEAFGLSVSWDGLSKSVYVGAQPVKPAALANTGSGDFMGRERVRYAEDSAYELCRQIENEIGVQIFYLPEWTEQTDESRSLISYAHFSDFDRQDGSTKAIYFDAVREELQTMRKAFSKYPAGFIKEVISKKNHKTEIVMCPALRGAFANGIYVYDRGAQPYVDIIYFTHGSEWYYSHEMGHMVVEAAMIRNGWKDSSTWWDNVNANATRADFVSDYAMVGGRNEDCAEVWSYLWTYTGMVREACAQSYVLRQKISYLTDMLVKHYRTIRVDDLPWRDMLLS
jgi:hypothetical protein